VQSATMAVAEAKPEVETKKKYSEL
jgi:hypothetical protein